MVEEQTTRELVLSEPLTWREICARYLDEWVALVEIDWVNENDLDFRSARVVGHGKTRREPMAQAKLLWARYEEIGHFFTGPIRMPFSSSVFAPWGICAPLRTPLSRPAAARSVRRPDVTLDGRIRQPSRPR